MPYQSYIQFCNLISQKLVRVNVDHVESQVYIHVLNKLGFHLVAAFLVIEINSLLIIRHEDRLREIRLYDSYSKMYFICNFIH